MASTLLHDARTLYKLLLSPIRGASHAERLESFYRQQAESYDAFRDRMLHGRKELWDQLSLPKDAVVVDMGCGTGRNLELAGTRVNDWRQTYLVDLSPSLLKVAAERVRRHGWPNVTTLQGDATSVDLPEGSADAVTFSYSLTMIPDWFAAVDHACRLLRPGGLLAIVDFYVSRKYPSSGQRKHSAFTRNFWPFWFGHDNVNLSTDHLPYLQRRLETVQLHEDSGKVPYLPLVRVPYYYFIGRLPA